MCILQHQKSDKNSSINSCFEEYVIKSVKNRFNLRNFKKINLLKHKFLSIPSHAKCQISKNSLIFKPLRPVPSTKTVKKRFFSADFFHEPPAFFQFLTPLFILEPHYKRPSLDNTLIPTFSSIKYSLTLKTNSLEVSCQIFQTDFFHEPSAFFQFLTPLFILELHFIKTITR